MLLDEVGVSRGQMGCEEFRPFFVDLFNYQDAFRWVVWCWDAGAEFGSTGGRIHVPGPAEWVHV